ncbi:hypothetical protein LCGC14_2614420 [marine sediment metagenome]|uniref:Uncharacterized protein n=1 Tax=marine sediment metagenome TaxID=412755 RepID=A0A0F9A556_9ZZZZ
MNSKLQMKLFKKYPKIFRQRKLSMKETCMCWGISCGNGWYTLIDSLCAAINNFEPSSQIEATGVKEKFGGLRFHIDRKSEWVSGAIQMAEIMSYRICETCGSTDDVKQTKGYIMSLCKEHRKQCTQSKKL